MQEGANLRALMREEHNGTKNEQARARMVQQYVVQMASLDGIVARNRYDANNLYESLEVREGPRGRRGWVVWVVWVRERPRGRRGWVVWVRERPRGRRG